AATAADLRIRVGVNTGPVVVGIVGTDTAHEYTAMGDAVNIAARMQSHAEPGTVLITAATHRFIAPLVEARDIGAVELKGKADAVHAYAIRGLKPGAATPRGLAGVRAPLIGRDTELAQLRQAFGVVRAGRGRIATVLGEPGLGKTRLLSELRIEAERADATTTWIEGRCLSYGERIPYHLVIDVVRSIIGVSPSADEPQVREALAKRIGERSEDDETYAYLGHLLSVRLTDAERARVAALEIETVKRYIASFVHLLRAVTARGPVILVCEDLHWADAASVDVLYSSSRFSRTCASSASSLHGSSAPPADGDSSRARATCSATRLPRSISSRSPATTAARSSPACCGSSRCRPRRATSSSPRPRGTLSSSRRSSACSWIAVRSFAKTSAG